MLNTQVIAYILIKEYDRYSLDGTSFSSWVNRVVLADGSVLTGAYINYADCAVDVGDSKPLQNVCGQFFYDVNGAGHPPNKTGEDVFVFWFTKYGVVPMGTQAETTYSFKDYCNMAAKSKLYLLVHKLKLIDLLKKIVL